jgi:hypothetical protein
MGYCGLCTVDEKLSFLELPTIQWSGGDVMAFTQDDLDSIKRARVALALGTRIEAVTIAGDSYTFSSGASDRDLARLEGRIESELDADWNPAAHATNGGRG